MKKWMLIGCGWFFVAIGAIGAVLPILPTTPFLILALACFAKSSPRFHQMLLDNRWFGEGLRDWEKHRSMSRKSKRRATVVVVATFSLSIFMLSDRPYLQLMLVGFAILALTMMWRVKETPPNMELAEQSEIDTYENAHAKDESQPIQEPDKSHNLTPSDTAHDMPKAKKEKNYESNT